MYRRIKNTFAIEAVSLPFEELALPSTFHGDFSDEEVRGIALFDPLPANSYTWPLSTMCPTHSTTRSYFLIQWKNVMSGSCTGIFVCGHSGNGRSSVDPLRLYSIKSDVMYDSYTQHIEADKSTGACTCFHIFNSSQSWTLIVLTASWNQIINIQVLYGSHQEKCVVLPGCRSDCTERSSATL